MGERGTNLPSGILYSSCFPDDKHKSLGGRGFFCFVSLALLMFRILSGTQLVLKNIYGVAKFRKATHCDVTHWQPQDLPTAQYPVVPGTFPCSERGAARPSFSKSVF